MTWKHREHHISKTIELNFTYFWWQMYVGLLMCRLDFGGQKVKSQGHNRQ